MIADVVDDDHQPILSLSLVNEIFEYIHSDFKNIIYREGNVLFNNNNDNEDRRLPISVIFNSNLEDYFADVLLCDRYKSRLCDICAHRGQLESLKWARCKGCPWTESHPYRVIGTCCVAARAGHLHILQWARENGCDWNSETCYAAAGAGHLHILQWARENGCGWNSDTCRAAAGAGHLHILQWARENGCGWNPSTCSSAAEAGHLHTLQWARENGCDWDSWTCSTASGAGHWDTVAWAVLNGVSMDRDDDEDNGDEYYSSFNLCEYAASQDRWDIVQLAVNNGCSCTEEIQLELLSRLSIHNTTESTLHS